MLTSCVRQLSVNLDWETRLRQEVRLSPAHSRRDFDQLPILDAVIRETLRLYPPVAGGQPRNTNKMVVLCEVEVFSGAQVSAQAWTLHREGNVFGEDVESWRPDRWLNCSLGSERRKEMYRWFWAFGSESRKCIGEELGLSNLRVAIASI